MSLDPSFPTLVSYSLIDNVISPISPATINYQFAGPKPNQTNGYFFFRNLSDPNKPILAFSANGISGTINNYTQLSSLPSGNYELSYAAVFDSLNETTSPHDTIYYGGKYYNNVLTPSTKNPVFENLAT